MKHGIILLAVMLLTACASTPDTVLAPDPPPSYAPLAHPFKGAKLYHDPVTTAGKWAQANGNPAWLEPITGTPQAVWLTSPQDLERLPTLARAATAQRALLVLVAYYLPGRGCGKDGASDAPTYLGWIDRIVADLARTKAAIVVEPDAIPADCYTPERARLIRDAVGRLAAAGHYVYIDAGHPKWKSPGETAERLIESGIQAAQGFTINVSNRQTTADSDAWGREVSEMTGGREFLIDTSRNGAGPPPDDPQRDDEWCNPAHQGLGEKPTTAPKNSAAAALLWIKRPGESDGLCGGENTYEFAPRQAANLVANAEWVPQRLRAQARSA
jgi:endoglucanase